MIKGNRKNMKFVIQRVSNANVKVDNKIVGEIEKGYLILVGVCEEDTEEIANKMLEKMFKLRIWEDDCGKTNLSLNDVKGEILLVSQFTLYADCKKGNRPSFTKAGNPEFAKKMFDYIVNKCKELSLTKVETGIFGAIMKVELTNDGPFTILLDSKEM